MLKTKLKIVEIFYSLQGEGANTGKPFVFIRLSNCNLNCWFCDTDWNRGQEYTLEHLLNEVNQYSCKNILWTGGEPTLQLTDEILRHFEGYYHAIETNGTNEVPSLIDYITVSPKVKPSEIKPTRINEIRYPIELNTPIPSIKELPHAENYFLSPMFMGAPRQRFDMVKANVDYCIDYIKNHPEWRLSLQTHKILNIL